MILEESDKVDKQKEKIEIKESIILYSQRNWNIDLKFTQLNILCISKSISKEKAI